MKLLVTDLGIMPYQEALAIQRSAAKARISGELSHDTLFLVEHPPVVTLGRNSKASHLTVSAESLAAQGVELFEVERGGDVTFHGPGQLVGYPVFDLKGLKQDLHWYLRQIEEAVIRTLASHGVSGQRNPGQTGVWTTGKVGTSSVPPAPAGGLPEGNDGEVAAGRLRKIASIGVHAREWVTWHGFALNASTDLRYFDLMVPCGIPGVRMTSIEAETGSVVSMEALKRDVVAAMAEVFGYEG